MVKLTNPTRKEAKRVSSKSIKKEKKPLKSGEGPTAIR